jgi:hypothetical protein
MTTCIWRQHERTLNFHSDCDKEFIDDDEEMVHTFKHCPFCGFEIDVRLAGAPARDDDYPMDPNAEDYFI